MNISTAFRHFKNIIFIYRKINFLYDSSVNDHKSAKVNLGQIQSVLNSQKQPKTLIDVEFQVFSQFGDDGIIQWLVNQLPIKYKTFIEFGVENYRESNTRFLLINNCWSGLVIDGSEKNTSEIESHRVFTQYDLQVQCSFLSAENINDVINNAKFHKEVGLLSIDIDGNDYWLWKAIDSIEPVIVICEYNGLFGFSKPYTIEYRKDFVRGAQFPFNYYGTSLRSACDLAQTKGYAFIGCNSGGNNAYFIKKKYIKQLSIPELTPAEGYVFPIYTEVSDDKNVPLRGIKKVLSFDGLIAYNTHTNLSEVIDAKEIANSLIEAGKVYSIS